MNGFVAVDWNGFWDFIGEAPRSELIRPFPGTGKVLRSLIATVTHSTR
jgi:hypothetical protein